MARVAGGWGLVTSGPRHQPFRHVTNFQPPAIFRCWKLRSWHCLSRPASHVCLVSLAARGCYCVLLERLPHYRPPVFFTSCLKRFPVVRLLSIASLALVLPCFGCGVPWLMVRHPNPVFVPVPDPEVLHNALVDVVDDHFRIEREERVRVVDNTLTMGVIVSWFEMSSTIAEPWRSDTVSFYDKLESTFQTYRRKAEVYMVPTQGGFNVEIRVFKDLEDVPKPQNATAGSAMLRNEVSQINVRIPVTQQVTVTGWIPQGRDPNLEQKMISQLFVRLGLEPPWWLRGPRLYPATPAW